MWASSCEWRTAASSTTLPRLSRTRSSSGLGAKWAWINSLPLAMTSTISDAPAAMASSIAHSMTGRSTTGSISLGRTLVAGRKRVPNPAAGTTQCRIVYIGRALSLFVARLRRERLPPCPVGYDPDPMLDVRTDLIGAIRTILAEWGIEAQVEAIVDPSARPEFGDFSTPVPLRSARALRRPPMDIAGELRERLEALDLPFAGAWTASPPGYVNCRLDETVWAPAVIEQALSLDPATPLVVAGAPTQAGRTLVEHTATNPHKAAHVGHLRNACLGDTVVRILRRIGREVEVQNYIDDTGVQVADVIVGLRHLGLEPEPDEPFDQYCSRVYVEVGGRYEVEIGRAHG